MSLVVISGFPNRADVLRLDWPEAVQLRVGEH